ncbi:3-isopropylmalate dehydratase large subunit [Planctomicrobium piriforme]|uniref:3-isopropylmalate dehydratase large subunit n=1 Tax=Planctomicrobium piriforme TaxID=1576369 RepID=A0A1I3GJU9_9PLAN|nr:3-isopropylmalate dehydratase large subunit [Planctomicrobium piriforme]SFI23673.1 3-isopropylmalate/(R)-2-methylmalate dehydratase large subunit [Planctomicrobium piriforme]
MSDKRNLFEKVWDLHTVGTLPSGQTQLFIGLHLIHEVTSPQAFEMLRDRGLKVLAPERTMATVDHIVPTDVQLRPFKDELAEEMMSAIEKNCKEFGVTLLDIGGGKQGIVHAVGPEQGLTQPGLTIACGDSHTSTHGAFGTIAFGIGTSQVAYVLSTQTLAMNKPKVKRIVVNGELAPGVYAKDVILYIIRQLGVNGGVGYAYEYAGDVFDAMSMEERMTVCNMSIEGGARCGYCNPDMKTVEYLRGRPFTPKGAEFEKAAEWWLSLASPLDAHFDDEVVFDAGDIEPTVTWGINPGQSVGICEAIPAVEDFPAEEQAGVKEALLFMDLQAGQSMRGVKIDVAFIGSCTNGRISDLREAAEFVRGKHVAKGVKALVVPGSQLIAKQAESEGLDRIFSEAGFEWRSAGCSMCLAMNPDKLKGREICASSSNRNFKGRQGSPTGRTLLMSPVMVAAAAIEGHVTDAREMHAALV